MSWSILKNPEEFHGILLGSRGCESASKERRDSICKRRGIFNRSATRIRNRIRIMISFGGIQTGYCQSWRSNSIVNSIWIVKLALQRKERQERVHRRGNQLQLGTAPNWISLLAPIILPTTSWKWNAKLHYWMGLFDWFISQTGAWISIRNDLPLVMLNLNRC